MVPNGKNIMSDLIKTVLAVLITGVLSSVTTTQVLKVEITHVKSSVEKLDITMNDRVDKIEDRLLETQLKQAQYQSQYIAAN